MNFLDESFGAQSAPVELSEIVGTPIAPSLIPLGSVRNRAATAAMLSADPINTYQVLVKDGQENNPASYEDHKASLTKKQSQVDMQGLMTVLGDKNISLEDKRKAAEGLKSSLYLNDSSSILHSKSLAAGSKGENAYQESARITSADSIRQIHESRTQVQGLVNAYVASLSSDLPIVDGLSMMLAPLGNAINVSKASEGIAKAQGKPLSFWETLKGFAASGSKTQALRDHLNNIPVEKRAEATRQYLEGISKSNGLLFSNDNQFAQADLVRKIFDEGGYSSAEKWIDNLSPLLDAVGIGQLVRGSKTASRAATGASSGSVEAKWELVDEGIVKPPYKKLTDGIKRIEANASIRLENTAAPANVVSSANPEKARDIHSAVVKNETGEVAGALHGTDREQAIINDIMPQATTDTGAVTAKVADIDRNLRQELGVSEALIKNIEDTGAINFTAGEKASVRALVVNDFKSVEGLVAHDAETGISVVGGRVKIDVMYGTPEGGFLTARDASEQAKYALRKYGIKDEDITIMRKDGLDYVPTTVADEGLKEGSYKVRISTSHEITANEVSEFEPLITKWNLADSFSSTISERSGSLARYMMDAASMLDPKISGPAAVATDHISRFEKLLLTQVQDFTDQYVKFPKARQSEISKYLHEANSNRIKFNPAMLASRFSPEELNSIASFRKFWDTAWYFENSDVVKTLNANGFQMFKNNTTELYAKPIVKNQNIAWFYDPAVDDVVRYGKAEGDMLYAAGGTYAALRRPIDVNGVTVEHMIVRQTPTEYLRGFKDTDSVLPYIEGYYQTRYTKNAQFVDEVTTLASGKKTIRTVAVAKDSLEATHFANNMAKNTGKEYKVRGDANGLRRDSDEWWDVNAASGRIAQRRRGKLLEDASGLNHLGDGSYIVSPVESAERAAKSISGRIVTRNMLETAKARFVKQFENVLPDGVYGSKVFPSNHMQLGGKGRFTDKELKDARSNYEYIRYLENGYINGMDEFAKQMFNKAAIVAGAGSVKYGSKALAAIERGALQASDVSVTGVAKSAVYTTTIVSNVFRQWVVQPQQILRTFAYNPVGWASGEVPNLVSHWIAGVVSPSLITSPKFKAFNNFIERSGLVASVDKSNLIRGSLLDAADKSNKVMVALTKYTTQPLRRYGFDAGESVNIVGHAAAVYERELRAGKNMSDPSVLDSIHSEVRAISGEMNFAGDMPYNQTSPATLLQFIQVAHKMVLQPTNRRIAPSDRLKMFVADSVLWGVPGITLATYLVGTDILPEDDFVRESFVEGIKSALLNESLTNLAGKDIDLDFSSIAPVGDLKGWAKLFGALLEDGGFMRALMNSPSGQLFLQDGGRFQNAVGAMSRFFASIDSPEDTTEKGLAALKETAKIFSGASNLFKTQMILETGKLWDKNGKLIEEGLTNYEAAAQIFGIPTKSQRMHFEIIEKEKSEIKKHRETVLSDYKEIKRVVTEQLDKDSTDKDWIISVTSMAMKAYDSDPAAQKIVAGELEKDMTGRDVQFFQSFMRRLQLPTIGSLRDDVRKYPIPDEKKDQLMDIIDSLEKTRQQIKEEKK